MALSLTFVTNCILKMSLHIIYRTEKSCLACICVSVCVCVIKTEKKNKRGIICGDEKDPLEGEKRARERVMGNAYEQSTVIHMDTKCHS